MTSQPVPLLESDRLLDGTSVTVLMGSNSGKYPTSNSVLVAGSEGTLLVDASIDVHARGGAPGNVDRVLISHAHEDHIAGIEVFPEAAICAHSADLPALHSLDVYLDVYGMPEPMRTEWGKQVLSDFHYHPRADATGFADGDTFALGDTTVTIVHLPGHTRGHCGFLVEPDGVFYIADIDLSSFGPYYGDHWSDLEDFERAMDRAADVDARWYVTSHHKGVIEGKADFLSALSTFRSVIDRREQRLLSFLDEPRSIADIVTHRIIYRPGASGLLWIDHVEETSSRMHLQRLMRSGEVVEAEPGLFRSASVLP